MVASYKLNGLGDRRVLYYGASQIPFPKCNILKSSVNSFSSTILVLCKIEVIKIARRCDDVAFYQVNFSWLLVVVVPVAMHVFELIIGDYHKSMV
ncbi:hypothetical protein NC652_018472 [Populus alba x Populus x berolinensis]|nr:hypothetical protein NC652_018472 [Populus alba x Populus x berolinensis]